MVRQEDTDEGMSRVCVYASVAHHQNICWAGEDVRPGAVVVHAGERLTPAHLGVLSSVGVAQVRVVRRVRVCLLCTGDELMQPGQALPFGRIYDANRTVLTARLAELGAQAHVLTSEADDPQRVAAVLREAADQADLILTTGGTGFSPRDITPEATIQVVERLTPGIPEAMRAESMKITPKGCLSRSAAGIRGRTLIINLPGSKKASQENILAVIDPVAHGLDMLYSEGSADCAK